MKFIVKEKYLAKLKEHPPPQRAYRVIGILLDLHLTVIDLEYDNIKKPPSRANGKEL